MLLCTQSTRAGNVATDDGDTTPSTIAIAAAAAYFCVSE